MKRDEGGAAVIETALCLCFIVLPLVFATIAYAYMLSFRQTVSQSVAEGARAAAVAPSTATLAQRQAVAKAAVTAALQSGSGNLTCTSPYVTCTVAPVTNCGDGSGNDCMRVTVSYPYKDHSLLPIPGLGFAMPDTITYSAVAEVS
ncbi:MAG: TadE/TadG family type IV pilus assembly protein [Marmoricola sp.]